MRKPTRQVLEAVLFLPAMVLLAAVVFGAFALIIVGGNYAVYAWYWLLHDAIGLPHSAALALTVLAAALTVYGIFYGLGQIPRRKATRR